MVLGGRSTAVVGNDKTLIAGTALLLCGAVQRDGRDQYSRYLHDAQGHRDGDGYHEDRRHTVGNHWRYAIGQDGGADSTEIGGAHMLKVAGLSSTQVGGAITSQAGAAISLAAGAAVTISAGGAVTVPSASVTITAGVINLVGWSMSLACSTSPGVVTTTSLVSPLYTPGVGNIILGLQRHGEEQSPRPGCCSACRTCMADVAPSAAPTISIWPAAVLREQLRSADRQHACGHWRKPCTDRAAQ